MIFGGVGRFRGFFCFSQRVLRFVVLGEIAKHEDDSANGPIRSPNGRFTIIDRHFGSVLPNQQRVIRQSQDSAILEHLVHWARDRSAGVFIDNAYI